MCVCVCVCVCVSDLLLAGLGHRSCAGSSLVVVSRGSSPAAVLGCMVVASLVGARSRVCGLRSCGPRAPEHRLSACGTQD